MIFLNRDILVASRQAGIKEELTEKEIESLDAILRKVETAESFCTAHELVNRNKITSRSAAILKETRFYRLKPFRFLINKN
jgi:hypothetical protein